MLAGRQQQNGLPVPCPCAGVGGDEAAAADGEGQDAPSAGRRRRWGQHVSVAAENTQLYLLAPKTDAYGLGFDPFKGAEDFRQLKEAARAAARPGAAGSEPGKKRRRGIAFGAGEAGRRWAIMPLAQGWPRANPGMSNLGGAFGLCAGPCNSRYACAAS